MTKKSIIIVAISTLFAIFVIFLCLFLAVKRMDATISSFTTESSESEVPVPAANAGLGTADVPTPEELATEAASSDEGPHFDILAGVTYTSSGNSLALYLDAVPVSANKYYVAGSAYHMGKLMPSMNIKDFFSHPENEAQASSKGKKKSGKTVKTPSPDNEAEPNEYQDSTGNISLRFISDSTIFIRDARSSSIMPFSGELHLAKAAPSENSISENSVSDDSVSGDTLSPPK